MIVISGALVLVAAVLLVVGIISSITLVYAAIGLSIVSAVFLLVGVFQRPAPSSEPRDSGGDYTRRRSARDEVDEDADAPDERDETAQHIDLVEAEGGYDGSEDDDSYEAYEPHDSDQGVDGVGGVEEIAAEYPLEEANADFEVRSGATGADVLVISGRPRYHVGGCDYVEGNDDSEPLEINEARELGFTPCGACRPNETLARSAAGQEQTAAQRPSPAPKSGKSRGEPEREPVAVSEPEPAIVDEPEPAMVDEPVEPVEPVDEPVAEPETTSFEPAPVTVAAVPVRKPEDAQQNHKPRRTPAKPRRAKGPEASEPVARAAAPAPPAEPAPPPVASEPPTAKVSAPAEVPATPAPEAAAAPATAPEAPAAAGRPTRGRTVLAVASTKEYHRPGCELLAGAQTEEMSRTAAIRQAYLACGVCRP